jgi:hypothetical protein
LLFRFLQRKKQTYHYESNDFVTLKRIGTMKGFLSSQNVSHHFVMRRSLRQDGGRCGASVADGRAGRNNCGEIVAGNLPGREKHSIFALSKGTNDIPTTERNNK